jgi:hypothetical protein
MKKYTTYCFLTCKSWWHPWILYTAPWLESIIVYSSANSSDDALETTLRIVILEVIVKIRVIVIIKVTIIVVVILTVISYSYQ